MPNLVNYGHRRENAAFGERLGSKRPLIVGCLSNYSPFIALDNHFSLSSFWRLKWVEREREKGMIKAKFTSSSS